jgi:hypothetical protein
VDGRARTTCQSQTELRIRVKRLLADDQQRFRRERMAMHQAVGRVDTRSILLASPDRSAEIPESADLYG